MIRSHHRTRCRGNATNSWNAGEFNKRRHFGRQGGIPTHSTSPRPLQLSYRVLDPKPKVTKE